jgi:hypothetical protein
MIFCVPVFKAAPSDDHEGTDNYGCFSTCSCFLFLVWDAPPSSRILWITPEHRPASKCLDFYPSKHLGFEFEESGDRLGVARVNCPFNIAVSFQSSSYSIQIASQFLPSNWFAGHESKPIKTNQMRHKVGVSYHHTISIFSPVEPNQFCFSLGALRSILDMPVAGVGNCGQNDDGTLGPILPSN